MSTHLITGYAGKEHITSADQGSFNAAVMGGGEFVMERGEQFRCQVISNNNVRIYDGDALMQGRHIIIDRNTYEETTHENGTQGYKRIDLIVLSYEKDEDSSVESVKLEVIKGAPAENNPIVPEYTKGDILNSGASKNQMPLYKIPFDGLSIGEPVKLFTTVPTLEGMKADVDEKVDEKITEMEEAFEKLETGIEEEIAAAGKPLSSNAADWPMIQNYGEYSADAKTVGEEFSKVNESLNKEYTYIGIGSGTDGTVLDIGEYTEILFYAQSNQGKYCPTFISVNVLKAIGKVCTNVVWSTDFSQIWVSLDSNNIFKAHSYNGNTNMDFQTVVYAR